MSGTLLLGAGNSRIKHVSLNFNDHWIEPLVTLDMDAASEPDILMDISGRGWVLPFGPETFDEVHAYEVLEHLAPQGDYLSFFYLFTEVHRVTKPGGLFCAKVPAAGSPWVWGDPGHTRVIQRESLVFLDQDEYTAQVGVTPMTDYRAIYKGNWKLVGVGDDNDSFSFVLRAA